MNGGCSVSDVLDLAENKLCGAHSFQLSDVNHPLAILSQRFDLEMLLHHPQMVKPAEFDICTYAN